MNINKLKKINLPMVINENNIVQFFKYFDFFEEYDDKDYITDRYEFDYGFGMRKYSNAFFIFDVEVNVDDGENYILRNVEYVVAREIFNPIELVELEKYCPCSKCSSLNVSKLLPINKDIFIKYCIGKYKTKFIALPLV